MPTSVTASMLYDLVQCPHRVTMDLFGDPRKRDKINPFVELLWKKGHAHEKEFIGDVGIPYLDLSIYGAPGRIRTCDLCLRRAAQKPPVISNWL